MTILNSIHMENRALFDITVSPKSSRSEVTIDASGKIKEKEGIQILEGYSEMSVEWSVEIF